MSSQVTCPKCGQSVDALKKVDASILANMKEEGNSFPPEICEACSRELVKNAAKGSILVAREKAREQRKLMLWKSRVPLLKKARAQMLGKAFSEAAVSYEKYVRVLEVMFDAKPGGLLPEHFKESARTQELTVVASVFWDLIRIYDTSDKYGDRLRQTTEKLAQFLRFTPIYPDIMRKAEAFSRTCRNQSVLKSFLKSASDSKSRCFIATSAFESPWAEEVEILRTFRDEKLLSNKFGIIFVQTYYRLSPPIARFMDKNALSRALVRKLLRLIVHRALRH